MSQSPSIARLLPLLQRMKGAGASAETKQETAQRLVYLLGEVAYAAHRAMENGETHRNGKSVILRNPWHADLTEALNTIDELPDIGDGIVRDGWLVAVDMLKSMLTPLIMPGTPSSKWLVEGKPDPHGSYYNGERAALAHGRLTDDELANAVFMCDHRTSLESIGLTTAAKERIRWLSRNLNAAMARADAAEAKLAAMIRTDGLPNSTIQTFAPDVYVQAQQQEQQ